MAKLSIKDLDLKGKIVFIRVDFNVPLANAGKEITSDKRIQARRCRRFSTRSNKAPASFSRRISKAEGCRNLRR